MSKSPRLKMSDVLSDIRFSNQSIILHGPGGTGKTFLLREIALMYQKMNVMLQLTALTGVAALNLVMKEHKIAAQTLHSWSGIGINHDNPSKIIAKIRSSHSLMNRWKHVKILVIDEISMLGDEMFNLLNMIAQSVRGNKEPFGGIRLILSGDFLQLPPITQGWVFNSMTWLSLDLRPIILREPKRYPDVMYFEMLLRIRSGYHNEDDMNVLRSRLVAYGEWKERDKAVGEIKPTRLYGRRVDVDGYNISKLMKLEGPSTTYDAHDQSTGNGSRFFPMLDDTIPSVIELRVGAQVMLKCNLSVDDGFVNGSRGVVMSLQRNSVTVKFMNGKTKDIMYHVWSIEGKEGTATRSQIPLRLAYAMTIHSSQGSSLDFAIVNLGKREIFVPAQAYVALSRVRTLEGLLVEALNVKKIVPNQEALSYVESLESLNKSE